MAKPVVSYYRQYATMKEQVLTHEFLCRVNYRLARTGYCSSRIYRTTSPGTTYTTSLDDTVAFDRLGLEMTRKPKALRLWCLTM